MSLMICGRVVDHDQPLFVVAELGLNHGGHLARALRMVDAAADAGASAVKVQSFRADRLIAPGCPPPSHVHATSLRSFFHAFELDESDHRAIADRAHERGLAMIATPFDEDVVGWLESAGCDAYKIASGDVTFPALIKRAAATGKPLLLSTGMSDVEDVRLALETARTAGARHLVLLHCVSAYPVPAGQENLGALTELSRLFGVTVGLSDHSSDLLSVPLAVALGASVYERHFALDGEPDQIERELSSTPDELRTVIEMAERARAVLGDGRKVCRPAERGNRSASRRSLHATRNLRAGEVLDVSAVVPLRPATGIDPRRADEAIGRRLVRDVTAGEPIGAADLAGWGVKGVLRDVA
jgi:sialic acid synthase SpsE